MLQAAARRCFQRRRSIIAGWLYVYRGECKACFRSLVELLGHIAAAGGDGWTGEKWRRAAALQKKDAPRFPGARVIFDKAVRLAAAGSAVAGAAVAAAVSALACFLRRGREGQGEDRQDCEEEFFHFDILR